jgi:hypothetical protein
MHAGFPAIGAAVALALAVSASSCSGAERRDAPAGNGVRAYVAALRADDPRAAWRLLSDDVKAGTSYEAFAAAWKASELERRRQATELEEGLQGDPDLAERAVVTYRDGKSVRLRRATGPWRVDTGLVSRVHASSPRDAVEIFAAALDSRSYQGVMSILTTRRREGISRMVADFASSLRKAKKNPGIQEFPDRAEMTWEQDGVEYELVLLKEGNEWRVDDFDVRPMPRVTP